MSIALLILKYQIINLNLPVLFKILTGVQMKKFLIFIIISISTFTTTSAQSWEMFTTENSNLPVDYIDNLVVDSNDNLWFHTKSPIFMYNQSEDKWHEFNQSNSNLTDGFTHISIGNDGSVYIYSSHIFKFKENVMNFEIVEENIICDKFVFDNNGVLYFVKQVNIYSKKGDKIKEIYNGQIGGPNYPTELLIDINENLWFAIDGYTSALYSYDGSKLDTLDSLFKENPRIGINSISLDKNNNIWLGTGLECVLLNYNIQDRNWVYFDNKNSPLGKENIFLKDSKVDKNNNVWTITAFYNSSAPISLFKYNGSAWLEFSIDEAFNISENELFSLLSLAIDSKNNVWIGTNEGLIKFNETTTNIEINIEGGIGIYPNPASNQLTIDLKEKQAISYTISDIKGNIVENRKHSYSGQMDINLKSYPIGNYIIELTLANNQKITNKFVKE